MLVMLLLLAQSAAVPQVAVVEVSTLGLSEAEAGVLRVQLKAGLATEALDVEVARDACADSACLRALAHRLSACVVGVTLVKNKKGVTVDLEAVDDAGPVAQDTFVFTGDRLDRSPDALAFALRLARKLGGDRPVAAATPALTSVPLDRPPMPQLVASGRPQRRGSQVVVGGIAAGVGAVAVGLLIGSVVVKGQLDGALAEQPVVSSMTRVQAQQRADLANGLLGGGLVALGLGLAGGTTALVLELGSDAEP